MEYTGFKTLRLSEDEQSHFYTSLHDGINSELGCIPNEYVLLEDTDGNAVEQYRYVDNDFVRVPFKVINTRFCGKIKPRNEQQIVAVDMLYQPDITVKLLSGVYGSGKDFLMCTAAIDLLEKGKVERIVYVRNNIEVKDSRQIGHLPGSGTEKLMPYAMVLADKLGGVDSLEMMIGQGKIELVHLGFIRGRDIKNSIIYVSEAENMTKEHIQLLLGRVGEGSQLWINGDFRQTDLEVFARNSGMRVAIDKLKGHKRFGYVKLIKTERSETAAMADLLD